jgi:glycosyltransferase involved in cell wall biosynthesis
LLREKLSALVIAYNRAPIIGTCVRALGFADELIVVDKSSTDGTGAIAAQYADLVITVPWSPTPRLRSGAMHARLDRLSG